MDLLVPRRLLELKKSRNRGKKSENKSGILPPVALGVTQPGPDVEFDVQLDAKEYPNIFHLMIYPAPGLLAGIDRGGDLSQIQLQYFNLGHEKGRATNVMTREPRINGPFAKMLAKVAYCYAVAERGFDAFDGTQIRDLLAGRRGDVYNFVGNIDQPEPLANRHLHGLYFRNRVDWLTVLIHLFASCNADANKPVIPYEVVVGKSL
jgi:hypothetical protein